MTMPLILFNRIISNYSNPPLENARQQRIFVSSSFSSKTLSYPTHHTTKSPQITTNSLHVFSVSSVTYPTRFIITLLVGCHWVSFTRIQCFRVKSSWWIISCRGNWRRIIRNWWCGIIILGRFVLERDLWLCYVGLSFFCSSAKHWANR